jgi:hypothetical protein
LLQERVCFPEAEIDALLKLDGQFLLFPCFLVFCYLLLQLSLVEQVRLSVPVYERIIGKYLSGLRKLTPIIGFTAGFEAQL